MALTNFKSAPLTFMNNIPILEKNVKENKRMLEKEIGDKKIDLTDISNYQSGVDIKKRKKLWYLRNRGIYVGLNKDKTQFISPQDITKEQALEIARLVDKQLVHVQMLRDMLFKFGVVSEEFKRRASNIYELGESFLQLARILESGSIEKMKNFGTIKSDDKGYLIDLLVNPKKLESSQNEDIQKILKIFFTPIISKLTEFNKNREKDEKSRFYYERLKHYNEAQAQLYEKSLEILKSLNNNSLNIEDLNAFLSLLSNIN